jgi:DNA-binding LacI/PurR family transcriptional regulator
LIGFDDVYASVTTPPLTVISLRIPAVGQTAADLALRMAADPDAIAQLKNHREYVPMELVVRQSTAPARANI